MEVTQLSEPVELFRYLRTLVDTAEASRDRFPKFALVEAYWHIGRIVVEIEQHGQTRADYGIHLIESLSQQLSDTYGKGYGLSNMWRFKQFFLAFQILATEGREFEQLRQHLRAELYWSHYRLLMQLDDPQERNFYIQQAADQRWTVTFMQRMIKNRYYHKSALNEQNLLPVLPDSTGKSTRRVTLTPTLSVSSNKARTRLSGIKKIVLERYVGYAFVAQRQFVSVAGQDQWVELVFFHYVLNRFILVQLGEHDPATTTHLRSLLDSYSIKQPPTIDKPPVGLLINQSGVVMIQTTSQEPVLAPDQEAVLPRHF